MHIGDNSRVRVVRAIPGGGMASAGATTPVDAEKRFCRSAQEAVEGVVWMEGRADGAPGHVPFSLELIEETAGEESFRIRAIA